MALETTFYNVANDKIPKELSGYRMALLSDIHNQKFGKGNADLICPLRELKPDVILIPGDAVNKNRKDKSPKGGYENVVPLFKKLSAIAPVLYSNGNHEARFADNNRYEGYYGAYIRVLKNLGVSVLNNKGLYISKKKLRFAGLDLPADYYRGKKYHPVVDAVHLSELMGPADPEAYNILLAHTPEYFSAYLEWGADLVVSGHVHGGIIRIPTVGGLLSPHRTFFPGYDYGYYKSDSHEMIVSSGLATMSFPKRINNPPEIVMITLNSGSGKEQYAAEF